VGVISSLGHKRCAVDGGDCDASEKSKKACLRVDSGLMKEMLSKVDFKAHSEAELASTNVETSSSQVSIDKNHSMIIEIFGNVRSFLEEWGRQETHRDESICHSMRVLTDMLGDMDKSLRSVQASVIDMQASIGNLNEIFHDILITMSKDTHDERAVKEDQAREV
jgi:hypothetical protein